MKMKLANFKFSGIDKYSIAGLFARCDFDWAIPFVVSDIALNIVKEDEKGDFLPIGLPTLQQEMRGFSSVLVGNPDGGDSLLNYIKSKIVDNPGVGKWLCLNMLCAYYNFAENDISLLKLIESFSPDEAEALFSTLYHYSRGEYETSGACHVNVRAVNSMAVKCVKAANAHGSDDITYLPMHATYRNYFGDFDSVYQSTTEGDIGMHAISLSAHSVAHMPHMLLSIIEAEGKARVHAPLMYLDEDVLASVRESDARDYATQFHLNKPWMFNAYSWMDVLQSIEAFCTGKEEALSESEMLNTLNKSRFGHIDPVDVEAEWNDVIKVSAMVKDSGFLDRLQDSEINIFALMDQSVAIDERTVDQFVDKFEPVIVGSTATRRVWPTMNTSAHAILLMRIIEKRMELGGEHKATVDTYAYAALRIALPSILHLRNSSLDHLSDHPQFSEGYMRESVIDFIYQSGFFDRRDLINREHIEQAFARLPKALINVDTQLLVGIALSPEQREVANSDQRKKSACIDFGL